MAEAPSRAIDLGRLAPGLRKTCEDYLGTYRESLERGARSGESGLVVAQKHARQLDGLLGALFCASDAASRASGVAPKGRVALVAVGGWGRGLVGLRSDIDCMFLCDDPGDRHVGDLAEGVLYPLWDLGLTIGPIVRGVSETIELARDDLRTATTLLDLRAVAGSRALVEELHRTARRKVFDVALEGFLDALEDDMGTRHERYGGSLYLLEPEVKQGKGGLRDADCIRWAARARYAVTHSEELVKHGALRERELRELEAAEELLWRVRHLLHARAGRKHDRLTFEDQEDIATQLGFVDGVTLGVEQLMQSYYRHARTVATTLDRVLARVRPEKRPLIPTKSTPIADGVLQFGDSVTLADKERLAAEPALAMRLYAQVVERDLLPYDFARDAVAKYTGDAAFAQRLRDSKEAPATFLKLLSHAGDVPLRRGSILGELHEVGLLLAMIPEFEPVTGRVQHDVYHVYTVDVHSIAAVDRLRALARGELAQDMPLACQLAAETPRPLPLYLGLLLHDVGKGRGGKHAEVGADLARAIAPRLGLAPHDVDHVVWLVREHLSLYHWATRRDTSDPATIEEVAKLVGSVDRLRDLYLLTVADLSTTSPTAMTSWKARMLDDLYLAVVGALEGDRDTSTHQRADEIRAEVRIGLGRDPALEAFVDEMPARYVLAHAPDAIHAHAEIAKRRGDAPVHLATRPGPGEGLTELVFVTDDRPGLLADFAAAITANRLAVISAQVHTRAPATSGGRKPEAFDVFVVRRAGRGDGGAGAAWLPKLARDVDDLLAGRVTAKALLASRPKPPAWAARKGPDVPTEVRVDNGASPKFTVIDVYTRDRVGLLHTIARTLHAQGLTISLSKINTEGLRVADVFYVTAKAGDKLRDAGKLAQLPLLLREAIAALDAQAGTGGEGETAT